MTNTVLIYALSLPHRHLLSLVCALLRARVVTPLCSAHLPLSVLSVSLCLHPVAPPFPLTIPPLASIAIPPTDSPSPWDDMVVHSATDLSLPLSYKAVHKKTRPPPLPPDLGVHGDSNVPVCWGRSRPQAQMSPSTKGLRSTCPRRALASHPLSLSPLVPQEHRQTHLHRIWVLRPLPVPGAQIILCGLYPRMLPTSTILRMQKILFQLNREPSDSRSHSSHLRRASATFLWYFLLRGKNGRRSSS